jgi:CheY-like chemotaxis protein
MRKKVLIVEDNALLADAMASIVEDELGCTPVTVESTTGALALIDDSLGLALLDVDVVDGTTYPIAARMMQRNIPIVFVSGSDPARVPRDLAQAPFLRKPVRPSQLLAVARRYL